MTDDALGNTNSTIRNNPEFEVPDLERVSLAIDRNLLTRLDAIVKRAGYGNRSEAMRDLIRNRLSEETEAVAPEKQSVATVTLVYDHSKREVADQLLEVGHDHNDEVVATMHIHLDRDRCLEIVALRGMAGNLRAIADRLLMMKGVEQGKVVFTGPQAPAKQSR